MGCHGLVDCPTYGTQQGYLLAMDQIAYKLMKGPVNLSELFPLDYLGRSTSEEKRVREAPPQKKRENVGIFPKRGTPPLPSSQFGNVMFVRRKKNYG